jgi:N-acetylneuraminic acid mutarotase
MKRVYLLLLIASTIFNQISCIPEKCCMIPGQLGNWVKRAQLNQPVRSEAVGFTIGQFIYMGTGQDSLLHSLGDFWQYDPVNNSWKEVAALPSGAERTAAVGFSIDQWGFCGTGFNGSTYLNDFYRYDPNINTWTKSNAKFPGISRSEAVAFSIGHSGYVGTGYDGSHVLGDFYRYDPSPDIWTAIPFPGQPRYSTNVFVYQNKSYLVTGTNGDSLLSDFWVFDPSLPGVGWNQLNPIVNASGNAYDDGYTTIVRTNAAAFVIGNKGYISTGEQGGTPINYTWEYDFANDLWTEKTPFEGPTATGAIGISVAGKGFITTGRYVSGHSQYPAFIWEFQPDLIMNPNDN